HVLEGGGRQASDCIEIFRTFRADLHVFTPMAALQVHCSDNGFSGEYAAHDGRADPVTGIGGLASLVEAGDRSAMWELRSETCCRGQAVDCAVIQVHAVLEVPW